MRLSRTALYVVVFISSFVAGSTLVNLTIDDSDLETIRYVPSTNWQPSGNTTCSGCLKPDIKLALQQTVHYGLHASPPDADDKVAKRGHDGSGSGKGKPVAASAPDDDDDDEVVVETGKNASVPTAADNKGDADDAEVDVMASLNFTGSAFYVYCVLPMQNGDGAISSMTNLTFMLDGLPVGSFVHNPQPDTGDAPDFKYQVPVFFKRDLPQAQHTLDIKAELGSAVLLDYVKYSTLDADGSTISSPGSMPSTTMAGQKSGGGKGGGDDDATAQGNSKKNATTFGLAIGLTVGVLALVSLGVCFSLIRRRRRSARLQRHLAAEEAAAARSGPEMRGPEPFIPRYFPGTAVRPSAHSPPPSPSIHGDDGMEEIGPSHGLNLPRAPEHMEAPEYSPPLMVSTGHNVTHIPVPQISPSSALIDTDDSPPRYQDAGQSLLVSIPYTYPPPPPPPPPSLLPYSPSSPRPSSSESSQGSTTVVRVSSRHSDGDPPRSPAPLLDEPRINTTHGDWQR